MPCRTQGSPTDTPRSDVRPLAVIAADNPDDHSLEGLPFHSQPIEADTALGAGGVLGLGSVGFETSCVVRVACMGMKDPNPRRSSHPST